MHVLFAETSQKNKIYKHFEAALSRLPTATRLEAVHSDVDPGNSYYLAWNSGLKLLQQPTQLATPQFFRRLIAGYTGIDNQWDYRKYPFEENIFETLRRVGCHKRAA